MKTLTKFFNPIFNQSHSIAHYEVIENETLKNSDLKGLSISGSLFSLTTFVNVTFESCVFYGSVIKNSTFSNCNFIDCRFEFCEITETDFRGTSFQNCSWDFSPIRGNFFMYCDLDGKTTFFAGKEENEMISCRCNEDVTWEEALAPTDEEVSTEKHYDNLSDYLGDKTRTILTMFKIAA